MKKCYLPIAILAAAVSAQAAEQPALHAGKVVVTATRSDYDIDDIPGSVTVIESAQLAQTPGDTLDQKLGALTGAVTSRSNGIYSFSATVMLRGFGTAEQGRTLVLLDGVPVNTSATGSVNWNRLSLEDIDRVEIYKGPASSLYGSNAIGGVINIITKKTPAPANAKVDASYGTYDTYTMRGLGGMDNGKFYVSGALYRMHSNGYISTPDSQKTAYTTERNAADTDAGVKAGWRFSPENTLETAYSYYDGVRGEGTRNNTQDGSQRLHKTHFARANWQNKSEQAQWQVNGYYQNENYGRVQDASATKYINTDGNRIDSGVQGGLSYKLHENLTLTPGLDVTKGSVDTTDTDHRNGDVTINNRGKLLQVAPYLQAEGKAFDNKLKALVGVRYDNDSFTDGYYYNPLKPAWNTPTGDLSDHYWSRFTPKASVGWNYTDKLEQYVSYGQGFRAPNLEDMCLSLQRGSNKVLVGNPDLSPEVVTTWETGFKVNPASGFSIEPAVYYTKGKDFISEAATGETIPGMGAIYKKINLSEVELYGAELSATATLLEGVTANANYAYTHSKIISASLYPALDGKHLINSPETAASFVLAWENAIANISGSWQYKSNFYTDDLNTTSVGAYSTFGAKVWKSFPKGITASLAVDNIADQRYQESETDMAPGRTFTGTVSVKF